MSGASNSGICLSIVGLIVPFSTDVDSQIAPKTSDFGYPLSTKHGMPYYEDDYSMLMKCFKRFVKGIMQMGGVSDSTCQSLVGLNVIFSTAVNSQLAYNIPDFGYTLSTANGMIHCDGRHSLPMKCFKSFLRCIGGWEVYRIASTSHLLVSSYHFNLL